jgi:tRNA pseudouridine38-40 synthase
LPTFRITLAYDGTDYVGWQRQAEGPSIQGAVEDALRAIDERDVIVIGAGRTDAGVHAYGQVAGFTIARALSAEAVSRALNARLPADIRVVASEEVDAAFHARFDAISKTYRYRIWNGNAVSPFERRYVWHVAAPLDVAAMADAARLFEGTHDFAAFQAAGSATKTTVREVLHSALRTSHFEIITFDVEGTGFLRHMVRAIVGTLVEVGRGRRPPVWVADVLASRDRARAGPTAPASGLVLVSVAYGAPRALAAEP